MNLEPIELESLSDEAACSLHEFLNAARSEILPEDAPVSFSERVTAWRNRSPTQGGRHFRAVEANRVIGYAEAEWDEADAQNPHLAWADVMVAPSHRRRGVGTALLHHLLTSSLRAGKTHFLTDTTSRVPSGGAFVANLDAKLGQESHVHQLLLSDLNVEYLRAALEHAPTERFEIGSYQESFPESELAALCDLFEVMNSEPRGALDVNDRRFKPEDLRLATERMKARGVQWWLFYVRERNTGRLAGYTETRFHPDHPTFVYQRATGVLPEFRGQGLGAWLKSAMLERIVKERPTADRVRTGNADSNAPMLRINQALGFKPFLSRAEWQLEIAATLRRLGKRG
jgi:mycothiol synthase